MEYPTQEGHLLLPEYGRYVQHMVDYALTLPDREARNQCAEAIVQAMQIVHPETKGADLRHTFYDHLALISGFQLDIDYPFGTPEQEELQLLPEHLQYRNGAFAFRHYGRFIQAFIHEACEEQDEARREELIILIANRLKYSYLVWNKDHVDEEQIKADIERLSQGKLSCDFPGFFLLHSHQLLPANEKNSGKKKKKK